MSNDNGFEIRNSKTDEVEMTEVNRIKAFELAAVFVNCGTPVYVWSRKLRQVLTAE